MCLHICVSTDANPAKPEEIRLFVLREVGEAHDLGKKATGLVAQTAARFGISRQGAYRHVRSLVDEGSLVATGSNKGRTYDLAILERQVGNDPLPDLEEHAVWRKYAAAIMESVPGPVVELAHFCFTEMVNNAIDHSSGTDLTVRIERTALHVRMHVTDNGVGIFRKIREALNLDDERHAMLELCKGKFTTEPKRHSGLGIFFSSKSCQKFVISSGKILFGHFRSGRDWLMDDFSDDITGTEITMTIDLDTDKRLNKVWDEYSTPNNPGFSRTTIPVAVAQYGDENLIARSQAKRVLARVEKFKEVVFDFTGVSIVGQAFADEIFRVFAQTHPDVTLIPYGANTQIEGMVDLAIQAREPAVSA